MLYMYERLAGCYGTFVCRSYVLWTSDARGSHAVPSKYAQRVVRKPYVSRGEENNSASLAALALHIRLDSCPTTTWVCRSNSSPLLLVPFAQFGPQLVCRYKLTRGMCNLPRHDLNIDTGLTFPSALKHVSLLPPPAHRRGSEYNSITLTLS